MSSLKGRPKAKNPKNISIKIRFDEKTYNDLIEYSKKHKITRTEAIRRGVTLVLEKDK